MRIPAFTTLALALATSVVAAAPERNAAPPAHESTAPTRQEATGRVAYGDAIAKSPVAAVAPADPWVELASATPASHGREFIVVDSETGPVTHLRLSAAAGRPVIRSLRIDDARGGHRTFHVGKTLSARRATTIDLRGARDLSQIVVISDAGSRGSYVVSARPGTTGVAMR